MTAYIYSLPYSFTLTLDPLWKKKISNKQNLDFGLMTMEALSHQLRASEYLITPSKRRRQEGGGEDQFCFNEDDMELAKSLMMLSNGDKEKTDVKVEVLVVAPPCTAPLTESKKVSGGQCYKCSVCG